MHYKRVEVHTPHLRVLSICGSTIDKAVVVRDLELTMKDHINKIASLLLVSTTFGGCGNFETTLVTHRDKVSDETMSDDASTESS